MRPLFTLPRFWPPSPSCAKCLRDVPRCPLRQTRRIELFVLGTIKSRKSPGRFLPDEKVPVQREKVITGIGKLLQVVSPSTEFGFCDALPARDKCANHFRQTVAVGVPVVLRVHKNKHIPLPNHKSSTPQTCCQCPREDGTREVLIPCFENPVHPLRVARMPYGRSPIRIQQGRAAAGSQNSMKLAKRRIQVPNVFEDLG